MFSKKSDGIQAKKERRTSITLLVNPALALESVLTGALSSSTGKSKFMIPVEICCCQCTTVPERVTNLGGKGDQLRRNDCSISPVSVFTKNGIFSFPAGL